MKRIFLFILPATFATVFLSSANAQPGIEWQRCAGGQNAVAIAETKDGFVVAGIYSGFDSTDISFCSYSDSVATFVTKLDQKGVILWRRCFSGKGQNWVTSIFATTDGGSIFCGYTTALFGEGIIFHGAIDAWVVKLDSVGNIQWQNCYGGSESDFAASIIQTFDGGYAFAGWTNSLDGNVTGNNGAGDEWVVKLSPSGKIEWEKCLGGSNYDRAGAVIQIADSGFMICGTTFSNDGNVSGNHGGKDLWVVKLKADTSIAWQTCAGGISDDGGDAICRINNGNYIAVGISQSYFLNDNYHGGEDFYAVILNDSGKIISQSCYGGSQDDAANSVSPTNTGGYLIAGQSNSSDGDLTRSRSDFQDAWLIKCDSEGNLEWERSLGGRWDESAFSVLQSSDGGYVFAGETSSLSGDVTSNYHGDGGWNSWIVKLSDNASASGPNNLGNADLQIIPNPASGELIISYNAISAMHTQIFIYDVLGNRLLQTIDNSSFIGKRQITFDISTLPVGIYLLRLQCGNHSVTEKFSILR